jgi:hypothetical protein
MPDTNLAVYGFADLSEITGMSTSTLSTLLHRGRKNRAQGKNFPNDIPEPDGKFGTSPVWRHDTVQEWLTVRASGEGAARVKRAVDPERSLSSGKAVPVEPKPQPKSASAAKSKKTVAATHSTEAGTVGPGDVATVTGTEMYLGQGKVVTEAGEVKGIGAGKTLLRKFRTLRGRR